MSAREEVGVAGYLEVIVRDRHGRVKCRLGGPPLGARKHFLKRLADGVKRLFGDPPVAPEAVSYSGPVSDSIIRFHAKTLTYNMKYKVTVTQTSGTLRAFPYGFVLEVLGAV
jgi:hypothetical protein